MCDMYSLFSFSLVYPEMLGAAHKPIFPHAGPRSREKTVQYQHPKGAPDADAIFGTK